MVQGKGMKVLANVILTIMAVIAILPIILLLIGSFTDNATALAEGFSYTPSKLSIEAYRYIVNAWSNDLAHIPATEFKSDDGRDFSVITFTFTEDHTVPWPTPPPASRSRAPGNKPATVLTTTPWALF